MKKLVYLLFVSCLFAISCGETDEQPGNTFDECPANLGCTEIFVSLIFSPKNNNNQAISLDSFYTQNLDNGNTYNVQHNDAQQTNSYTVITDGQLSEINKEGTKIRFTGLQGDQVVIQQDFVVGHDCCHVTAVNGPFDQ